VPNSQSGKVLEVNRALIQKGEDRQLVYYWFRQRGRNISNEYLAKGYLLWDALTRNRSDGALVRFTTRIPRYETTEAAELRMRAFIATLQPEMTRFIPD
jgi:EpsI family protein